MEIEYIISIENPESHYAKVVLRGNRPKSEGRLRLFLPRWSPGSYLIREYARHIRQLHAYQGNGESLWVEKVAASEWEVDWTRSELKSENNNFEIHYLVYCHEFSVRTSWIDSEHAFLHLPTLLMGIAGQELNGPKLELRFPALWSKITTALNDISPKREVFLYQATNYDQLIDCPIEIGCHETDGFMLENVPHGWAYFGHPFENGREIKQDIKKICSEVNSFWGGELPFKNYQFITHFVAGSFGGLEHANSTALHFDPALLAKRSDYVEFLALACHEYIHAWNIKRLRPMGLGPFDYLKEAPTQMLWLAEGLTSYLDDLLVFRSGLSTIEEYSSQLKKALQRYEKTPGRHQQTLAEAGRDAWIVLYRPDENSHNSAISYYLKGKISFLVLHLELFLLQKSFQELVQRWWGLYLKHPEKGVSENEILWEIEDYAGPEVKERFWKALHTTEDLAYKKLLSQVGVELQTPASDRIDWGIDWKLSGERLLVRQVKRDGPAFKAGLNADDEILFMNDRRVLASESSDLTSWCGVNRKVHLKICRQGRLLEKVLLPHMAPEEIQTLVIKNPTLWESFLKN